MIDLKIISNRKESVVRKDEVQRIYSQVEEIIGKKMENVYDYDPSFGGYYLMNFDSYIQRKEVLTKENAKKLFLLGVPNSFVVSLLEKFDLIGLVQMRFTVSNKRTFFASKNILEKNNVSIFRDYFNSYSIAGFIEYDGQNNALAKTIVRYIKMYDDFTKKE